MKEFESKVAPNFTKFLPKVDGTAKEERDWFEESNRLDNANKAQNMGLRKSYAKLIFGVMCFWLAAVLSVVIFDGFHYDGFALQPTVVITLLSTTTANMLGIWAIIFKYLFKDKN